jgi:molecular chaperone GrpE
VTKINSADETMNEQSADPGETTLDRQGPDAREDSTADGDGADGTDGTDGAGEKTVGAGDEPGGAADAPLDAQEVPEEVPEEAGEEAGEDVDLVEPDGKPEPGGEPEIEASDRLREELDELNDRHLRLAAEFNNYRRRQENALMGAWGRAQADLLARFLDVLDDLQRVSALELSDESVTAQSIVEGIDLVERKFLRALEEAGAEVVNPEEGEAFDPETMEAMMRVPDDTGEREDQVAQVFLKGYAFKGNLIRPARVSVYKG